MHVSEVMTREVRVLAPERSVREAARLMDELNVGILPVCEGNRLVGLLTDRDITVRAVAAGMPPDTTPVMAVMTTSPRCCAEDDEVAVAVDLMSALQVRRVPVLGRDGTLVGIVSLGDLAEDHAPGAEEALAGISSPSEPDRSGPAGRSRAGARAGEGARQPDPLSAQEHAELARRRARSPEPAATQGRLDDVAAEGLAANRGRADLGRRPDRDEDIVRAAFGTAGEEPGAGGPAAAGAASAGHDREGSQGDDLSFFHDDSGTASPRAAGYSADEVSELGIRTASPRARHVEPPASEEAVRSEGLQPPRPGRQPEDR